MEQMLQNRAAESVSRISLPTYAEIPNVGLYLEQVTKYINGYLDLLGCPQLTGSMISNYVKKKLVKNPVRKQYDREQIAWLLVIAIGKTVLSLEDLQLLIRLEQNERDTRAAYTDFCEMFLRVLTAVFRREPLCEEDRAAESDLQLLLHGSVIAVAHKLYLDRCFAIWQEERGEQKE